MSTPRGRRRRASALIEACDALIAAIAFTAGAAVTTRDRAGFTDCGVRVIDPWDAA
jgi:predicted nucleic acid-binding protein